MSALDSSASGNAPRPTVEYLIQALRGVQETTEKQISSVVRILHDELGGLLVSAMMDLSWVNQQLGAEAAQERLTRAHHALAAAIDLNRNLIEKLRPSILDNFGLAAAFRWYLTHTCERAATQCTHALPEYEPKLRPEASILLFRIGQETLSAVFAESSLKCVDFSMTIEGENLLLQLTHEHYGAETTDMLHASSNLCATILRIDSLGGSCSVRRSESGSVILAAFPLSAITPE
jgi:two-component system, NarL family, sensor histidine kinase UhpB